MCRYTSWFFTSFDASNDAIFDVYNSKIEFQKPKLIPIQQQHFLVKLVSFDASNAKQDKPRTDHL